MKNDNERESKKKMKTSKPFTMLIIIDSEAIINKLSDLLTISS